MPGKLFGKVGIAAALAVAVSLISWMGSGDAQMRIGALAHRLTPASPPPPVPGGVGARWRERHGVLDDPLARVRAGIVVEPGTWEAEHVPGFVGPPSPGSPDLPGVALASSAYLDTLSDRGLESLADFVGPPSTAAVIAAP